jgi:DNA-binding response OmpR family regulator
MSTGHVDVLLVEDNPEDTELAMHAFSRHHISNTVHHVSDGEEALDYLFRRGPYAGVTVTPNLVLLDLKLPTMDGLEVLRELRADPRTENVPVVILTASQKEKDRIEGYNLGVNSFIIKPVDFTQFTESVRQIGMYWLLLNAPPPTNGGGAR